MQEANFCSLEEKREGSREGGKNLTAGQARGPCGAEWAGCVVPGRRSWFLRSASCPSVSVQAALGVERSGIK